MTDAIDLIELPPADTALQIYQKPSGLDPYIERIRAEVTGHVPDLTTRKGREHIASLAFKVRKSKSALDALGKQLVDDLKEVPKKIDAERRRMRDALDALADEVRAPLDKWEAAEKARIAMHQAGIAWFKSRTDECRDMNGCDLMAAIGAVEVCTVDASWEEFEAEAHRAKAKALEALHAALAAREKYEAEQAELARLRAEADARAKRDEEERIAREAAERATREAEAKAQAEREAAARREADAKAAQERAERERLEAIERQKQAEARAEAEKLAAEQRAKEAAEAARQAEIDRQAREKAAAEAEQRRREDDREHRARVNRTALQAFIDAGMPEDCAKQAVTLIAKGAIPSIQISY